jgi:hypothetical protein
MAIDDNTSYELTGYQVKDLAQKIRAKADASSLASVATSGLYSDLIGTPTIPTVYNGKLTIKQNDTTIDEFTANQSSDTTISLTDTTYSDFAGATSSVAGVAGLVPAPAAGDDTKFLSGNGLWTTVSQYSLPIASSSTLGGIKVGNNLTIDPLTGVLDAGGSTYTAGNGIDITNDEISIDTSVVAELSDIPTVNDSTITIQKNGTTVDSFTTNAAANKTINITVPTTAADVSALPASTKYGASLSLSINSSTYVVTGQLKDQDGNDLGTAQTIDLPLESVVVSGSYDSQTKEVVLTLQNGSSIRFSVADLVSGLQPTLTAGSNITIDPTTNTISATDTTYSAGTNVQISAGNVISATDTTYSDFTGATSSVAGANGLVPAPAAGDQDKVLKGDGTWIEKSDKFVIMKYGEASAWSKFLDAYSNNKIVYCRASSNANPATGAQTRLAFMAYVSNETNPTSVEFQYVRSQSSKTDSQQCDQVFVYKLTNANGGTWTVESRNMAPKINVSGPITKTFTTGANATLTIGADAMTGATSSTAGAAGFVPAPSAGDQDKVLSGAGTWVTQSGGSSYTAGSHIDITNDVISAEGYIWGDTLTSATTPTGTVTSSMIADGTIQASDIATGVVPVITMTDTDPGEGVPLAANHFIAVYEP